MNWDALGAIAELVGAGGVVASLLYLAVQVRTSNRASAVQAKLDSTRLQTDFIDSMLDHPELNTVWLQGRKGLDPLSPEDKVIYSNLSFKAFWFFSASYFQFQKGTLSDGDWFESRAVIRYWLRGQGCRDWWKKMGRRNFRDEFVAFIESEIASVAAQHAVEPDVE